MKFLNYTIILLTLKIVIIKKVNELESDKILEKEKKIRAPK